MLILTGNPELHFLCIREQFKADLQLELDAIMNRDGISPLCLALAVDNLNDLIDEVRVIERACATMCREVPSCSTVVDGCGYYEQKCTFLEKTEHLQEELIKLKENLMRSHSDRHWIVRQIGAVQRYLDF
ncbi:uncharacterized protein N7479_008112 [Penicillium vulpinum]|uniref:uncharacterized protein n=1 Tax=Penicillium vulpinum TaxID=29845 RepID=UPI002546C6D1|nr:uncharacterized protein N7479_008112 [Penicillium vulpinum]KAJ5960962.1 hypothetical protein N7479_008112 [Penicillium vulpinum]